jgi:hypothetical protein
MKMYECVERYMNPPRGRVSVVDLTWPKFAKKGSGV